VSSTGGPTTNIINNIMHINHSGANININTSPNCQNNFIFNHTAPINLNFYKNGQNGEKKKGMLSDEQLNSLDPEIVRKLGELNDCDKEQVKNSLKDPSSEIAKQY